MSLYKFQMFQIDLTLPIAIHGLVASLTRNARNQLGISYF
jgi:hypothetical protein